MSEALKFNYVRRLRAVPHASSKLTSLAGEATGSSASADEQITPKPTLRGKLQRLSVVGTNRPGRLDR